MRQTAIETLNDLILINNDRMKGYERALKDTKDDDLKALFRNMIEQSRRFNIDLVEQVEYEGAKAETETSVSGKLHRTWMDIKATFSGHNRRSLLIECEKGEDASKEAYNEALHEDSGLSSKQLDIIALQAEELHVSHNKIKALRDEALHH